MRLLVVHTAGMESLTQLPTAGWTLYHASSLQDAVSIAQQETLDAVIARRPNAVAPTADQVTTTSNLQERTHFDRLLRVMQTKRIAGLLMDDTHTHSEEQPDSLIEWLTSDVSAAEIHGRLTAIARYHTVVRHLEQELRGLERIGMRLQERFGDMEQEMRLASRLQRDFLPHLERPFGPAQFASIYRPATWVSGDMFDVVRVDEHHIGMYVADAVGHGMAASLLTMFIKHAIQPKRIMGQQYNLIPPAEVIRNLNAVLAEQSLPNCQFVTAWYGLLDLRSLVLTYARGGHPHPLFLGCDGTVGELRGTGGLLGLFPDETFSQQQLQLQPGDKLLLFSDGVEVAFQGVDESHDPNAYRALFESIASLDIVSGIARLETHLDRSSGSLSPKDDVTILGMEILPQ